MSGILTAIRESITASYSEYSHWLIGQISQPFSANNYFTMLIIISLLVYACELLCPWRRHQSRLRKDFWLDTFYMFFNFFLFGLICYKALADLSVLGLDSMSEALFQSSLSLGLIPDFIKQLDTWQHLLLLFVVRDFIQWWTHRLLHRVPQLWRFHQVHHSVQEMGFAAHLRYHWMENIIYNSIQFIPLAILGFQLQEFFIVAAITTTIGHLNHANIMLPLGPLKYILNNPQMHIWHHAKDIFEEHPHGVNFGLTLSCWDYLFGTAHIPSDGRDITLGFEGVEDYPSGFIQQSLSGFSNK